MNAIIKYPGAKWGIAEWIISHFPPHHRDLEPFFGSGAVLFNKQRSAMTVSCTTTSCRGGSGSVFPPVRRQQSRGKRSCG